MIPEIKFKYSSAHDLFWKKYLETYYKAYKDPRTKKILENYPSSKKLESYIKRVELVWKNKEKVILKEISHITGLKWKEPIIKAYLVGNCFPYSDPITMTPYKETNDFVDVFTHELIHQIQSQNSQTFKKWLNYLKKTYKNEGRTTQSHILLHAVHKEIYLKVFDKKRLERNLKRSVKDQYKKAWQIIEDEGQKEIIKKFRSIIKS